MGQITLEERRRIRLNRINRQSASFELIRPLPAPLPTSKPLATRARFRRVCEIAIIATLLTAGWFVSHIVELHPPRSFADMVPRL